MASIAKHVDRGAHHNGLCDPSEEMATCECHPSLHHVRDLLRQRRQRQREMFPFSGRPPMVFGERKPSMLSSVNAAAQAAPGVMRDRPWGCLSLSHLQRSNDSMLCPSVAIPATFRRMPSRSSNRRMSGESAPSLSHTTSATLYDPLSPHPRAKAVVNLGLAEAMISTAAQAHRKATERRRSSLALSLRQNRAGSAAPSVTQHPGIPHVARVKASRGPTRAMMARHSSSSIGRRTTTTPLLTYHSLTLSSKDGNGNDRALNGSPIEQPCVKPQHSYPSLHAPGSLVEIAVANPYTVPQCSDASAPATGIALSGSSASETAGSGMDTHRHESVGWGGPAGLTASRESVSDVVYPHALCSTSSHTTPTMTHKQLTSAFYRTFQGKSMATNAYLYYLGQGMTHSEESHERRGHGKSISGNRVSHSHPHHHSKVDSKRGHSLSMNAACIPTDRLQGNDTWNTARTPTMAPLAGPYQQVQGPLGPPIPTYSEMLRPSTTSTCKTRSRSSSFIRQLNTTPSRKVPKDRPHSKNPHPVRPSSSPQNANSKSPDDDGASSHHRRLCELILRSQNRYQAQQRQ